MTDRPDPAAAQLRTAVRIARSALTDYDATTPGQRTDVQRAEQLGLCSEALRILLAAVDTTVRTDAEQLLAVWDRRHPAPTDGPDQRHLLEEIAHPETTAALYALAARAGVAR